MNRARLAKKNSLAVKIMTAFALARIAILIMNNKETDKFGLLLTLYVIFAIGNVVIYLVDNGSPFVKYTSITVFGIITTIHFANSASLINIIPAFVAVGMCVIYMDIMHINFTGLILTIVTLIQAIMKIVDIGFMDSITWIEVSLIMFVFFIGVALACKITLSEQEVDKQEIEYHVQYQEEVTKNMVKVVDDGNEHIRRLQEQLNVFQKSTEEVTNSANEISKGVTDTVENMEESTSMTQEIQNVINNLISVKDETMSATEEAIKSVEIGLSVVEELKSKSQEIDETNLNVTRVAKELCEQIESVEEITQIIFQISSQTNLLALNASIEAARAGEAGRGFSVVADEIRNLADDTRNSIQNITNILEGVIALARKTSELINNSVVAVAEQAKGIEEADGSFNVISGVVGVLSDKVEELDRISDKLDISNNAIIDGLAHQMEYTEMISCNAEESAALCETNLEELNKVIDGLDEVAMIISSLENEDMD